MASSLYLLMFNHTTKLPEIFAKEKPALQVLCAEDPMTGALAVA